MRDPGARFERAEYAFKHRMTCDLDEAFVRHPGRGGHRIEPATAPGHDDRGVASRRHGFGTGHHQRTVRSAARPMSSNMHAGPSAVSAGLNVVNKPICAIT